MSSCGEKIFYNRKYGKFGNMFNMFDILKSILVYNACCENFCLLLSIISTTEIANITCSFKITIKFQSPATKNNKLSITRTVTLITMLPVIIVVLSRSQNPEASSHLIGFLRAIKDLRLNVT